jgi:purine-cytosine permease-like protein
LAAVVFGVLGTAVALTGLGDAGARYENFLLIISYWVGPWVAIVLTERFLTRHVPTGPLLGDARYTNWSGLISFTLGVVVSVWLFSNQSYYTGPIPKAHPGIGDITSAAGFVITILCHLVLRRVSRLAPRGGVSP